MGDGVRQNISRMAPREAGAALALAVVLALGAGAAQSAQAQTFTVLYNFTGGADGGNPYAGLVRDASGNSTAPPLTAALSAGVPERFSGCTAATRPRCTAFVS